MTLEEKIKELQETKKDLQLLLWLQELQVFRDELEKGLLVSTV